MGRAKGSQNKEQKPPLVVQLDTPDKLSLLADLLVEIIVKEEADAASKS